MKKIPLPRCAFLPSALLGLALFNGCAAAARPTAAPAATTSATASAPGPRLSAEKTVARNNAASLLFQLVEDEKNVHVILLVKGNRADVASLVQAISATAGDASKNLLLLAQADPTLNLHATDLPAGEVAARAAIAKVKTHQLLLSTGDNFEFALLLTQADALSYGYNLAQIAADNSSDPVQRQTFTAIREAMKSQYQQVIAFIRTSAK